MTTRLWAMPIFSAAWHGKIKVREELKWLEKWDHGN
jgi:hypothetical protein